MKKSWTLSGLNTLHGTASKICEARRISNLQRGFRFALQQAQHAILRAIVHNNPTSPASESAWKALVLSSWLLLGRPAVNASESNCAHFLDARLELFWAEDWSALWAMARAECDVAPVQNTTRRTDKQQMQSRVRKVATLARSGEKRRALAAARNAPPVPVTEQIVQEIKSLYPADPEQPAPVSAPVSALFLSEVAEHVPTTLRKMPRLSEPGPLGMRAEHWFDFGSLAGNSDLFVQVIAHIAAAAVPSSVLQYLKAGQITPLAKPTGGHRPLLMMSFLRRLALKSVMAAKKESVAKWTIAVRCWKTGWCKHDDQDHSVPCGSRQLSSPCCS